MGVSGSPPGVVGVVEHPGRVPDEKLPPRELLLGFITRFVQYNKLNEPIVVKRDHGDTFLTLYPLTQRVRRYARAYVRLGHHGMSAEGQPLVRAALEHAVTAQWVFYTKDGVERMRVSTAKDHLKFVRDVGGLSDDDPGVRKILEDMPPGPGLQNWAQIRKALEGSENFLGSTYAVLSQSVHPAHGAWFDAIHVDDEGNISLRDAPEDLYRDPIVYALASSCMLAWWLEAVCLGDEHRKRALLEDGHTLSMPASLANRLPPDLLRPDV